MAFGNKSKPTRKWNYGLREFLPGPRPKDDQGHKLHRQRFAGHDLAVAQMKLAHQFQNKLVELERLRRQRMEEILVQQCPELATLHNAAEVTQTVLTVLRENLSQSNSQNRQLVSNPELVEQIKDQKKLVAEAWEAYQTLRQEAFARSSVKPLLKSNDKLSETEKADARTAAVQGGLYWATSLQVMTRVKRTGPPPHFQPWTGEEVISVQFQKKPDKDSPRMPVLDSKGNPRIHPRSKRPMSAAVNGSSLKTEDVFKPNSNAWIETTWQGIPYPCPHPTHCVLHFRVSSDAKGKPAFASIPMVYSRDLPENAEVKWVHISRRKIGTHYKWDVQFDVAKDEWTYHPAGAARAHKGTVAVALGWRLIDGEIRVAEWMGSDGVRGTIRIHQEQVEAWDQLDSLQSTRDSLFEQDRDELVQWLGTQTDLPEEWKERTETLPAWRSADRFMWLIWWWKDHRLAGDEEVYAKLEGHRYFNSVTGNHRYSGGRKQSRHLLDWRSYKRENLRNWRKDFFRKVAIDLSYQYKDVVIAEIDWNEIAENPEVECGNEIVNKHYRALSSCAQMRDELTKYMNEVKQPAKDIVQLCCVCQNRMEPPGKGRWVRCERCGDGKRDRAVNAARNLLNKALGAMASATA